MNQPIDPQSILCRATRIVKAAVYFVLLTGLYYAPALHAQQVAWSDFQSSISAKDLIGLSADQAFDRLLQAGHSCGAVATSIGGYKEVTTEPVISCIITRNDPEPGKCQVMEIYVSTIPHEQSSLAEFLRSLAKKRVIAVNATCIGQTFSPNIRGNQLKGQIGLTEHIAELKLVGVSGAVAQAQLRGEGYLCSGEMNQSVSCIRPHTPDRFCAAPAVQLTLVAEPRDTSSADAWSTQSVDARLVTAVSAECSIPWWLQDD